MAVAAALVTRSMGLWGAASPTASFGSREAVEVSRVTRIVPRAATGEPIAHYVVQLREGTAADGSAIDVSAFPLLDVADGGEGFSLGDFGELSEGTYEVTVTPDDESPRFTPPMTVVDEDPGSGGESAPPEELVIETPAGDVSGQGSDAAPARLGRYAAFLRVLRAIEAEHGEPTIVTSDTGVEASSTSWLNGLCYADLVDFGDGVERLVVAYGADPALASRHPGDTDCYNVEVYGYDEQTDSAALLWEGHHSYSNGGEAYVIFSAPIDDGRRYIAVQHADAGLVALVGLVDDGSFGVAHTAEAGMRIVDGDFEGYYYMLDGQEVDQQTYLDLLERYGVGQDERAKTYELTHSAYSTYDINETAQLAQATVAKLEALAGDLLDASDAAEATSDPADDPAPDPASLTYTGTEGIETVSLPEWGNGTSAPTGTTERSWGCLSVAASGEGSAADAVNERLRADYEDDLAAAQGWTFDDEYAETLERRSSLDGQHGRYVGVRVYRYVTYWGAHGGNELEGYVFDMATGEEAEPWDALGVSRADLDAAAVEAIVSYVLAHPQAALYTDEGQVRTEAQRYVADDHYLLTSHGITVYLGDYAFYPFSEGTHELVAWPSDGTAAGTDVTEEFSFDLW